MILLKKQWNFRWTWVTEHVTTRSAFFGLWNTVGTPSGLESSGSQSHSEDSIYLTRSVTRSPITRRGNCKMIRNCNGPNLKTEHEIKFLFSIVIHWNNCSVRPKWSKFDTDPRRPGVQGGIWVQVVCAVTAHELYNFQWWTGHQSRVCWWRGEERIFGQNNYCLSSLTCLLTC